MMVSTINLKSAVVLIMSKASNANTVFFIVFSLYSA